MSVANRALACCVQAWETYTLDNAPEFNPGVSLTGFNYLEVWKVLCVCNASHLTVGEKKMTSAEHVGVCVRYSVCVCGCTYVCAFVHVFNVFICVRVHMILCTCVGVGGCIYMCV